VQVCARPLLHRQRDALHALAARREREQGTRGDHSVDHSTGGADEGNDNPMVRQKAAQEILRGLIGVPREDLRAHLVARSARSEHAPGAKARAVYRAALMDAGSRRSASGHPEATARLGGPRPAAGLLIPLLYPSLLRLPLG